MRYRNVLAAYFAMARYFLWQMGFFENSFPLVPVKGRLNNHLRDKAPLFGQKLGNWGATVVSAVILYQIDQITPGKMGNCQACGDLGKSYLKIQKKYWLR